jgi:hypothetical protein
MVFDELFRGHLDALDLPVGYEQDDGIKAQFLILSKELRSENAAILLRRRILTSNQSQWRCLQSTTTCFTCLFRFSERRLPCGHSICEECIDLHYPRSRGAYTYSIGPCLLCGVDAKITMALKPVTVEPNVAAIDGGGVRGIIALVLLKRLQAALDSGHHLRDYFDYFAGTSAGTFSGSAAMASF